VIVGVIGFAGGDGEKEARAAGRIRR